MDLTESAKEFASLLPLGNAQEEEIIVPTSSPADAPPSERALAELGLICYIYI